MYHMKVYKMQPIIPFAAITLGGIITLRWGSDGHSPRMVWTLRPALTAACPFTKQTLGPY